MSQDFEFTEQHPPHEPPEPAETTPTPTPPSPAASASRPASAGKPASDRPDPLYRSPLSVGAGLIILLALAGGIGYLGVDSYRKAAAAPETPAPPAANDEAKPPAAATGTPPATAPGPDLAAEVEGLKSSLKAATDRLDAMAAAPDAKSLESRLDTIEKAQQRLGGVPDKLAALEDKVGAAAKVEPANEAMARIDAVDKRVGEIAQAIDAVKAEVAAMAKPAAASAEAAKPEDINMADQALSQGADLFNQKKYAESLDVFTKLQADHPEDARVWYFSALANGLATRNWAGETVRLVTKGVEREKAGTPEASKIDAVFSGLTTATGKDWLAAYRARAASR